MNIIDFNLNLPKEDTYKVLSKVLDSAMKRDIRTKLQALGIDNRTRLMELWSWKMNDYRLNTEEKAARDIERKTHMDKLLEKMPIEDWVLWVAHDRIWTIEYLIREANIRNIVIRVLLNSEDTTPVVESEPSETF